MFGGFMNAYNVRVIEYPNGEIQVRHYGTPLKRKEVDCYEKDMEFFHEEILDFDINPFTGKKPKEIYNFDNFLKSQEENERRSYNRTKNKIYEYSRCVKWEKFITLTFNADKVDRYNFDECSLIARKWLNNQRRNAPQLQYLLVPELHKDGAIHFHGLLANTGKMKFKDSGKRTKDKRIIYNMSAWKNGFTTAVDVYNTHGVSKYIAKYITKELCGLTKGKNRYFVSSNMPTPKLSTFLTFDDADFNELLDMLADSFGVEVVHISKPRNKETYVDVDYYELQERKA